jgi:polyisoprenoid-binding protein YceI
MSAAPASTATTWKIDPVHSVAEFRVRHMMISKGPDFFDAEKFPALTFQSSRVIRHADGRIVVAGPLTIHGATREVEFAVEGPTPATKDPWGNTRIGVSATTKIDRRDFGLTFNAALETGGVLVGEEVSITLELEFVQQA